MCSHQRYPGRIQDPMLAHVNYELDRRHREAERQRLLAEVRRTRPASLPAMVLPRRWLGVRLPAWAHGRQNPAESVTTTELSTAVPRAR